MLGCSSLEGFLQENGRIQWAWGQYSPGINPYSWVNLTNVLWVEYPIGVGFSRGEPTATNEEEPAAEFVEFFRNFQTIFNISNYKIYVTGESYAGIYKTGNNKMKHSLTAPQDAMFHMSQMP